MASLADTVPYLKGLKNKNARETYSGLIEWSYKEPENEARCKTRTEFIESQVRRKDVNLTIANYVNDRMARRVIQWMQNQQIRQSLIINNVLYKNKLILSMENIKDFLK
jgi:hypothetical protein